MLIPVNSIERDIDNIILNVDSDEGNGDWIRAARLVKDARMSDLRELENKKMYIEIDSK